MKECLQIIILDELCIASQYGINTYIKQLLNVLTSTNFFIFHIRVLEKNKEVNIVKINQYVTTIDIPQNIIKNRKSNYYFRNIFYILAQYLNCNIKSVFHFNYIFHDNIIDFIKELFPYSKTLYTAHSIAIPFYYGYSFIETSNFIDNHYNNINIKKERSFLSKIDIICCLSDSTQLLFKNFYKIDSKKLKRINNGIEECNKSLSYKEKVSIKRKYNLPSDRNSIILLYVGRIDFNKGLSYLIEAFTLLLNSNPNYYLVIAGNGNFEPFLNISRKSWNNIFFTGKLSKDAIYELYQVCDIGILPSLSEQCSYVAIEMMMFEMPIIVTDANGLDEMFQDNYNALKIKIDKTCNALLSTSEIVEKIQLLSTNNILMKKIGKNARQLYDMKYNINTLKNEILLLYIE